jgi:DNA topoisomerase-2
MNFDYILNFIHYFWPSLLKLPNFVTSLTTPIIKATKGKELIEFYNLSDYENWKNTMQGNWSIKYYKGLGTSTSNEAKEYFTDIKKKLINYVDDSIVINSIFTKQNESLDLIKKDKDLCDEAMTLAFEKKRSDDRKLWLRNYNKNLILNNSQKNVTISEFINKELIHFSDEDIHRSIPAFDGFKPSQRKVLYGTILKKLFLKKDEIRVAQLAGYVSEKTCYHHGEASLTGTIINMAQNFVGSNNINLLYPSGQMGSRLIGGKDAASPRYIYTYLAELTRLIFRPEDEPILNYLNDDGVMIEPEYFIPIIPVILVNGAEGIGTGFSTKIPSYNPLVIIDNIIAMMENKPLQPMIPWYKNFKGSIIPNPDKSTEYLVYGVCTKVDSNHIRVSELPIGYWTTDYKEFLDGLESKGIINSYTKCNY